MNYISLIIFVNLFIWGSWLWRYHIQLYYLKQQIHSKLKHHPDGQQYQSLDAFLTKVFKKARSRSASQQDRQRFNKQDDSFTYGEIDYLAFMTILEKAQPQPGETFIDLGSGSGKAIMTAALTFDFSQSIGVELLPSLCKLAQERIKKAQAIITSDECPFSDIALNRLSRIQVINADFLHIEITQCDILFINATCLTGSIWQNIQDKCLQLRTGSRVIVTSQQILLEPFQLLYQGRALMSWGTNAIRIYVRGER